MPKVYATTNGCDEGQLKSMHVRNYFVQNGYSVTSTFTDADYIIFFACGLTDPKEKDSLLLIQKFNSRKKKNARLLVWGCLPKINPKSLSKIYNGPVVGPKDVKFFESLLGKNKVSIDDVSANTVIPQKTSGIQVAPSMAYDPIIDVLKRVNKRLDLIRLPKRKWLFDTNSFFIRVSEGCSENCTYCSEKPAWGGVKSRPMEKILAELKTGLHKGYTRFFLAAADVGTYGIDIGSNAIELLRQMVSVDKEKNYAIIINQMHPASMIKLISGLEEVFASGKIEAFGCQVESGSKRILKLMGRRYSAEKWRACMLRINKKFPFIRLSTHIMIGFPTETDEDFDATLKLLDYPLFIDWLGFFLYSSRPTECAHRLPGHVDFKAKEQRFKKLYRKYLFMYSVNVILGNIRYILSKL
jgi:MiaB/RimO family radical SAM methylthiotransferase